MTACGNCHNEVERGSPTCPRCGAEMPKGFFASLVGTIFGKRPGAAEAGGAPTVEAAPKSTGSSAAPFAFEVEDVFSITGRGTVATGRVTRGSIAIGDEIAFRSPKGDLVTRRITGIEAFRKIVQVANEGDTVGLLLGKTVPSDVLVRGVIFERA
jgi:hypothetical protein